MWNYFQIEDDLNEVDIEIDKVDQQILELNKYQPRKSSVSFINQSILLLNLNMNMK